MLGDHLGLCHLKVTPLLAWPCSEQACQPAQQIGSLNSLEVEDSKQIHMVYLLHISARMCANRSDSLSKLLAL